MESSPALILRTLDRHLTGAGEVRLFGGAAFVLAIEATNNELEDLGLYLTHVFGPEQQVLSPGWREACRPVNLSGLSKLSVSCLGPVDLALTKMGRADDADLADVQFLLRTQQLDPATFRDAIEVAIVPPEYAELFAVAKPKVLALITAST